MATTITFLQKSDKCVLKNLSLIRNRQHMPDLIFIMTNST